MDRIAADRNKRVGGRSPSFVTKKAASSVTQGKKVSKFDEQLSVEASHKDTDILSVILSDGSIDMEAIQNLQDDVHSTGDMLLKKPGMDNVLAYRNAIQRLLRSIIPHLHKKESFSVLHKELTQDGTRVGKRKITIVHNINKKLNDILKMVLGTQVNQTHLMQSMDEIRGLIIDLLQ